MKYLQYFLTACFFFLLSTQVFAHPLDISINVFTLHKKSASVTTYMHSFEAQYFISEFIGEKVYDFQGVYDYEKQLFDYINQNLTFTNNGNTCNFVPEELVVTDDHIILTDGYEFEYRFECTEELNELLFENTLFVENFPLQTNKMLFYKAERGNFELIKQQILNTKLTTLPWNVNIEQDLSIPDSDNDGLTDEEERWYGTDAFNVDTDGDFYTDHEEVEMSYSPLSKDPGPEQVPRDRLPDFVLSSNNTQPPTDTKSPKPKPEGQLTLSGSPFLKQALETLTKFLNTTSVWGSVQIFAIVFLLGALHALQPGHGKTIFFSYLIGGERGFPDILRFASSLTITHILDVLLLGIAIHVFGLWADVSLYITTVQRIGALGLLIIALFVTYQAVKNLRSKQKKEENTLSNKKSSATLGILAGLAPCTYGWAIFMTILAIGKLEWLFPVLLTFAIGIFATVIAFGISIVYLRIISTDKITVFKEYSSLISGVFLLFFAIQMLLYVY